MTIETVIPRGCYLSILGEHGRILGSIPLETGDMLMGFTGSTVTVKKTSFIYVYNEKGVSISAYPG